MAYPNAHPSTRYAPAPLADLTDKQARERLSPAAIKGFLSIATHWRLRDIDARRLLGDVSHGLYYDMKKDHRRVLDADKLLRVSYLIGIFKALHILYGAKLADAWVQRANLNPVFAGQTPLDYLLKGGIPAMQTVRRLLDARRGGM